jgi:hypothetical protein
MTSMEIITIAQGVKQTGREWRQIAGSHLYARIIGCNVTVHPLGGRSMHDCEEVFIALAKDDGSTFFTKCSRQLFEMGWSV